MQKYTQKGALKPDQAENALAKSRIENLISPTHAPYGKFNYV